MFTKVTDEVINTQTTNTWTSNWVDYDSDNDDDLFIVNYDIETSNQMYRNDGGSFVEVSVSNLTTLNNGGISSVWIDVDYDGNKDCFVPINQGLTNYFYINDGEQNFALLTNDSLVDISGYNHGATFADYNNDGFLDVFISDFMPTSFNRLFYNNGDNSFTNMTNLSPGLDIGRSIGATWTDYDNDQDLFVPNENGENNNFYINNEDGTFTKDITIIISQDNTNCVARCWGDYGNDGFLDLFVSNASDLPNFLYHNSGGGSFTRVTDGDIGVDKGNSHGCSWADIDNDRDLDLFVSNDQNKTKFLYMNDGNGNLNRNNNEVIVSAENNTYGHNWSDFDLFVSTYSDEVNLFFTNNGNSNNKIEIKLVGSVSNKSAIGT